MLVVHSGSRGLGERILRTHTEAHGAGAAPDPAAYLARHDDAVRWGSLNRRVLAARVAYALGAEPTEPIVDQCHNLVEVRDGVYLHRKGAAPGDGRDVLVAGSRGTASYLVAAHAGPDANHSVAHGAGTAVRAKHRPSGIVVVVDEERQFSLNRRIALQLLRQRIEHGDEAARRAVTTARWRIHDDLVRGDPVRVERPEPQRPGRRG